MKKKTAKNNGLISDAARRVGDAATSAARSVGGAITSAAKRKVLLAKAKSALQDVIHAEAEYDRMMKLHDSERAAARKASTDKEQRKHERAAATAYSRALKAKAQSKKLERRSNDLGMRAAAAYANPSPAKPDLTDYKKRLAKLKETGKRSAFNALKKSGAAAGLSESRIASDARKALKQGKPKARQNPLEQTADATIEVSHHWRSGGESNRQRAIAAGQMDFWGESGNNAATVNPSDALTFAALKVGEWFHFANEPADALKQKRSAQTYFDPALAGQQRAAARVFKTGQLSNNAGIVTVKLKRAAVVRVAKSNPAGRAPRSAGKTHEVFTGTPSTKSETVEVSHLYKGQHIDELGSAPTLVLKDGRTLELGKGRALCATTRKKLVISGKPIAKPDPTLKGDDLKLVGEVEMYYYTAHKKHLRDRKPARYKHRASEGHGSPLRLHVDRFGFPVLVGTGYKIESRGIVG